MPDDELGELTWSEKVTIRRIRIGWTKAELAKESGVSRMTLWRTIECKDEGRRLAVTDALRTAVEDALRDGERRKREQDAADMDLAEAVA